MYFNYYVFINLFIIRLFIRLFFFFILLFFLEDVPHFYKNRYEDSYTIIYIYINTHMMSTFMYTCDIHIVIYLFIHPFILLLTPSFLCIYLLFSVFLRGNIAYISNNKNSKNLEGKTRKKNRFVVMHKKPNKRFEYDKKILQHVQKE